MLRGTSGEGDASKPSVGPDPYETAVTETLVSKRLPEIKKKLRPNRVLKEQNAAIGLRKAADGLVAAASGEDGWVNWSGLATLLRAAAMSLEIGACRLLNEPILWTI
jgi:hypothetical protein